MATLTRNPSTTPTDPQPPTVPTSGPSPAQASRFPPPPVPLGVRAFRTSPQAAASVPLPPSDRPHRFPISGTLSHPEGASSSSRGFGSFARSTTTTSPRVEIGRPSPVTAVNTTPDPFSSAPRPGEPPSTSAASHPAVAAGPPATTSTTESSASTSASTSTAAPSTSVSTQSTMASTSTAPNDVIDLTSSSPPPPHRSIASRFSHIALPGSASTNANAVAGPSRPRPATAPDSSDDDVVIVSERQAAPGPRRNPPRQSAPFRIASPPPYVLPPNAIATRAPRRSRPGAGLRTGEDASETRRLLEALAAEEGGAAAGAAAGAAEGRSAFLSQQARALEQANARAGRGRGGGPTGRRGGYLVHRAGAGAGAAGGGRGGGRTGGGGGAGTGPAPDPLDQLLAGAAGPAETYGGAFGGAGGAGGRFVNSTPQGYLQALYGIIGGGGGGGAGWDLFGGIGAGLGGFALGGLYGGGGGVGGGPAYNPTGWGGAAKVKAASRKYGVKMSHPNAVAKGFSRDIVEPSDDEDATNAGSSSTLQGVDRPSPPKRTKLTDGKSNPSSASSSSKTDLVPVCASCLSPLVMGGTGSRKVFGLRCGHVVCGGCLDSAKERVMDEKRGWVLNLETGKEEWVGGKGKGKGTVLTLEDDDGDDEENDEAARAEQARRDESLDRALREEDDRLLREEMENQMGPQSDQLDPDVDERAEWPYMPSSSPDERPYRLHGVPFRRASKAKASKAKGKAKATVDRPKPSSLLASTRRTTATGKGKGKAAPPIDPLAVKHDWTVCPVQACDGKDGDVLAAPGDDRRPFELYA
ncbi:hypothetical protein JCM10212_003865 [Sporobolomyces blumeae]